MNRQTYSPIVELRRYTLHPRRREELIELFDRQFVETQEAVGIQVIGQFRNIDDPDQFVWLRGFNDMSAREQSLNAFYSGPIWKSHRDAANATRITFSSYASPTQPLDSRLRMSLDSLQAAHQHVMDL
jgi:hypothetical protein